MSAVRQANTAGLCRSFQTGRQVDALAVNLTPIFDDIVQVDADVEPDLLIFEHSGMLFG